MEPLSHGATTGAPTPVAPSHAEVALALTHRLFPPRGASADQSIAELATELRGADALPAREQIAEIHLTMERFRTVRTGLGSADLCLDAVLQRAAGHPLALTAIALEAGRRAGLQLGTALHDGAYVVAHRRVAEPMGLDLTHDGDARIRPLPVGSLAWRCPHQLAGAIVNELVERGLRGGDLGLATRAAELHLALPLDAAQRQDARMRVGALRARLN